MTDRTEQAKQAFNVYCERHDSAYNGAAIPAWENLPSTVRAGWVAFVDAATPTPSDVALDVAENAMVSPQRVSAYYAERGYNAYCKAVEYRTHAGDPMPYWEGLPDDRRASWQRAGNLLRRY